MEIFDYAIQGVLWREGGYNNDPDDPGGATRNGISLRLLRDLGLDIDHDGDIDADDVRSLSDSDIRNIYRVEFWQKGRCDLIKSDILACKVLDMCVNMGPRQAWKLVQSCLNSYNFPGGTFLTVDGIPGINTLRALNTYEDFVMIQAIRSEQAIFYRRLIANNPKLEKYKTGWMRRCYSV